MFSLWQCPPPKEQKQDPCYIENGFSDVTLSDSYQLHREIEQQNSSEIFDTVDDLERKQLMRYGSIDCFLKSQRV